MSLENYEGNTFVAFLDISGFKELMQDEDEALRALDKLYGAGYSSLFAQRQFNSESRIDGLFISDSGVLFLKRDNQNLLACLKILLIVIGNINKVMIDNNFMLTTSIAYGRFSYQQRIEFVGIEKNPIYGNAYVSALLDNEKGKPKIQPGQCRILKQNLPGIVNSEIELQNTDEILGMVKERNRDNQHYYYYWMCNHPTDICEFERIYMNSYRLKYEGMLRALKGNR